MKPTLNKSASTASNAKYTEEQKTGLLKAWETFCIATPLWVNEDRAKADKFIEDLAAKYGKGVKSIVGVLTRYNVYVAKTAAKKSANGSQTKLELATAIGNVLRLTEAETESLSVAGKGALNKIFTALAQSKPIEVLTPEQESEKRLMVDGIAEIIALGGDSMADMSNLELSTLTDIYGELKDKAEDLASLQVCASQAD